MKDHLESLPHFCQRQAQTALRRKKGGIGPEPVPIQLIGLTDRFCIRILKGNRLFFRLPAFKIIDPPLPAAAFIVLTVNGTQLFKFSLRQVARHIVSSAIEFL